jgi:PAS domain S-box-containing protein
MPALRCLHSLCIRRKLLLLLLAPCVVVLLLAGTVLVGFQLAASRRNSERDLLTAAQIVAGNAAAAVHLKAEPAAARILQSLRVNEHILTAVLVAPDGKLFARYGQESTDPALAASAPALRARFRGHLLLVSAPVMLEGKPIATLHVLSDCRSVYPALVKAVLCWLLLVALVSVALARLLASRLQRLVSEPLLRLAATARHITDQADYSVRASEESDEEFGVLSRAFNQMLARIQAEEAALTASLQKMQALIHSIGGVVWECTPDTFHFTFVSRQSERIFGYAPELWLTNRHFWHEHLHPDDAPQALAACQAAVAARKPFSHEYRMLAADGRTLWVRQNGTVTVENDGPVGVRGIFLDITPQKQAAEQLEDLNRKLIETSRQIGRAEVATGVLHNVGNVLNSINISTQLISRQLRQSRHTVLGKVAALFREHAHDLAAYITAHPKGKLLPEFIGQLAEQTETDHTALLAEMQT